MNDTELMALSVLLHGKIICAEGENQLRYIRQECPAFTECIDPELERAIQTELERRKILKEATDGK